MNQIPSPLAGGVPPEGIQNVHAVRILLCHILSAVGLPMSKNDFARLFQENHLVDYFTLSTALAELKQEQQVSLVDEDGEACYQLCPLGREAAQVLAHTLPLSVREHTAEAAARLMARKRTERENDVSITPCGTGFNVQIVMHDTEVDLLNLKLFVPDEAQAQAVQERLLQDPAALYAQIIEFLTK